MRILFAHCFYRIPGGEDRHVREQVDLVSGAHDVELVSQANVDLSEGPVTAARMLYSRAKKREIGAVLDRFAPDVVHVHNAYPSLGPAVFLAARERAVPVVMTVHNFRLRCPNGLMFTEGAPCRRCEPGLYLNAVWHRCFPTKRQGVAYASALWVHRFGMRLEKQIARFIAPSEFVHRRLLDWGIEEERVRLVRHFVSRTQHGVTREQMGAHGVFFGRLSPEKGLATLLRALRLAGDPPFLIVGDGPQRNALERMATDEGLVNTKFLGWQSRENAGEVLSSARYVVIPSVSDETASLSALEALAAGRPLVVSDLGALPELVQSGAGITSRAGDADDLARKIAMSSRDDEFCLRASREARRVARASLTREHHLGELESVYRGCLPGD